MIERIYTRIWYLTLKYNCVTYYVLATKDPRTVRSEMVREFLFFFGPGPVCLRPIGFSPRIPVCNAVRITVVLSFQNSETKSMFPPGLEPGTFRVLGERDNHYTTETPVFCLCFQEASFLLRLIFENKRSHNHLHIFFQVQNSRKGHQGHHEQTYPCIDDISHGRDIELLKD